MLKDHPVIERIERIGYPYPEDDVKLGTDSYGVPIYRNDTLLEYEDFKFVEEELSDGEINLLRFLGAERVVV